MIPMRVRQSVLLMAVLILISVVQVYSQLPPPPPPPPASFASHTLTDMDGDSKADVMWRHTQTGDVAAWLMNGLVIKQAAIVSTGVSIVSAL